jgi:predicted AlkP superfamily pyrophosphatase or phosphodiesterase
MKKLLLNLLCGAAAVLGAGQAAMAGGHDAPAYHHVLLISIDGMHAVDLSNYIASHPSSALATLAGHGVRYDNAESTRPSDSFPGLLALVTGGTPRSTGVFYDVSYDRTLYSPSNTTCSGPAGVAATFDESIDVDQTSYTAGGTPGNVLSQINVNALPNGFVNGVCQHIYPHQFLRVNTIFEVIKASGLRTAWSDKHPAYDIVNGPSGAGVDDLYTVEVNSNDSITGADTTTGFHSVERNDQLKVNAVLNEIAGKNGAGTANPGVPAIFGMNFQSVSVGQKLGFSKFAEDAGLSGGYADALGASPNNGLQLGLDYVDAQLGAMVSALNTAGIAGDTLIIITAKHGQSPIDITTLNKISDSLYGAAPGMGALGSYTTDDVGLVWLDPTQEQKQYKAAEAYLKANAGALHIDTLLDQGSLEPRFRNPFGDARTPDFIAITTPGVIYTGSKSKIAEHGGFAANDHDVALLVSAPGIAPAVRNDSVETRQVAPTILHALGLSPQALQGVREDHTQVLPALPF